MDMPAWSGVDPVTGSSHACIAIVNVQGIPVKGIHVQGFQATREVFGAIVLSTQSYLEILRLGLGLGLGLGLELGILWESIDTTGHMIQHHLELFMLPNHVRVTHARCFVLCSDHTCRLSACTMSVRENRFNVLL